MSRATFTGFLAAVLLAATIQAAPAAAGQKVMAASPQPAAGAIKPGLSVKYYIEKFNHIDEVINAASWMKPVRGEPLPMLNYNVGQGKVLSNKNTDLVGAFIQGYLKIDEPGDYIITVQHNDGVRLWIGGEMLYNSPNVTPDLWSPDMQISFDQAGWYPIKMIYYEKKNTSTLELYWQPPGAGDIEFVPASALGHIPGEDDQTS